MKSKRILSLFLSLLMLFCSAGTEAFAVNESTVTVSFSLNMKGVLGKANDNSVLLNKKLTVTDINEDGKFSADEALLAAHNAYNTSSGYEVSGGYAQKVWGDTSGNYLFFINDEGIADSLTNCFLSDNDKFYVSVNKDGTYYADWYTFFDFEEIYAGENEEFTLTLKGHKGMTENDDEAKNTAIASANIGVWEEGELKPLENKKTDINGQVTLSFENEGTYYVSAEGNVTDSVTDFANYPQKVDADCPIMAPGCIVTVKKTEDMMSDEDAADMIYNEFSKTEYSKITSPLSFPILYNGKTYTNAVKYLKAWAYENTKRNVTVNYETYIYTSKYKDWSSGSLKEVSYDGLDSEGNVESDYFTDNKKKTMNRLEKVSFKVGKKTTEVISKIVVPVKSKERTAREIVEYVKEQFPFERIKLNNESADKVVDKLGENSSNPKLPTSCGLYSSSTVDVKWSAKNISGSSNALKISSNATTVIRPNVGEDNAVFDLTATIAAKSDSTVKDTAVIRVTVPAFSGIEVPFLVPSGAKLSLTDKYYKTAVAEKYIKKMENAPEGFDLYSCTLHTDAKGAAQKFDYKVEKSGFITKTGEVSVKSEDNDTVSVNLTASSSKDTRLKSFSVTSQNSDGFKFDYDKTEFSANASGQYVTVFAEAETEEATVKVSEYYSTLKNANSAKTASKTMTKDGVKCYLPDKEGTTLIKITVTAPSGSTQSEKTRDYILNITKSEPNDALTALSISVKPSGKGVKDNYADMVFGAEKEEVLSPSFVPGSKPRTYKYTVNYNRDKITVTPGFDAEYTVTLNGEKLTSKSQSSEVALNVGKNDLSLVAEKENYSAEYTLSIYRKNELYIKEITFDEGFCNEKFVTDGSDRSASATFDANADSINPKISVNTDEEADVYISVGNSVYKGKTDEKINVPVGDAEKITAYISVARNVDGVCEAQTYVVGFYRAEATSPDEVSSFLPAPGQFVNLAESYNNPQKTLAGTSEITLGSFGGNVVYKYNNPIKNDPKNPYGIDFIVKGNCFLDTTDGATSAGAAEPAAVMVSKDGVNWYELAGSEYYSASARKNVTVTYQNTDTDFKAATEVPWSDSDGESGVMPVVSVHPQNYFPNPATFSAYQSEINKNETYTAESVSFSGTMIDYGFYPFGYADSHAEKQGGKNVAANPYAENHKQIFNGDGFDLAWAVDNDGNPVELDEITYIKIYNPVLSYGSARGEISPEIKSVSRALPEESAVGVSQGLKSLQINGESVLLTKGTYKYTFDAKGASNFKFVPTAENQNANIYVSNVRVKSGEESKAESAVDKLRIIVQEDKKEPVIYIIDFENALTKENSADLISLTLTPGDITKNAEDDEISFSVENSVSAVKLQAETANRKAKATLSGGKIEEPLKMTNKVPTEALLLNVGENLFEIEIESENAKNKKTYYISITRESGSSSEKKDTISVKFSLTGVKNAISQKTVTIPKNSTVKYLTEMMFNNAGIKYKTDGIYISEIDGLAEFDKGENSGWLYRHNGKIADISYASRTLSNNDSIKWFYTEDYTKETGYEGNWDNVNTSHSSSKDKTDLGAEVKTETSVSGDKVTVTVSESAVKKALSEAEKSKEDSVFISSQDIKSAKTITFSIPREALKNAAEDKNLQIVIKTQYADILLGTDVLKSILKKCGDEKNIIIEIKDAEKNNAAEENKLKDAVCAEITVYAGKEKISEFDGESIVIKIPVSEKKYEDGNYYKVIILSENGKEDNTFGKCVKENGKYFVSIKSKHLSSFFVTDIKTAPFADVQNHWSEDAVKFVYENEIMRGVADEEFSPDEKLTRSMAVTVLYRAEKDAKITAENKFSDVPQNEWYTDAVVWAYENGIANGVDSSSFAPQRYITREEMASIIFRYAKLKGKISDKALSLDKYKDKDEVSAYAKDAFAWASDEGIIQGTDKNFLCPRAEATRGQTAAIIMRYLSGK